MFITLAKKNVDKYFKKRAKISREIHDTFFKVFIMLDSKTSNKFQQTKQKFQEKHM